MLGGLGVGIFGESQRIRVVFEQRELERCLRRFSEERHEGGRHLICVVGELGSLQS